MNVHQIACYVLALFVAIASASATCAAVAPNQSQPVGRASTLQLSDLRSAYLVRAGYVRYDAHRRSSAGIREQLRNHFDVVIGVLLTSTPHSVDLAIARLEASARQVWTDEERATWRRQLLKNRNIQILRLAAYRDRGRFPLNEGQAAGPVPIFVDRYETACAVGHLMRLSGRQQDVAVIQRTNNLIHVPDAARSSVARWALTSGITLEEAALIQPAYDGFHAPYLLSDYEPGELALVNSGLKYENFQFQIQDFQLQNATFHQALDNCPNPDACANLIPGAVIPPPEPVGFNAGSGFLSAPNDFFDPQGSHWITLGGSLYPPGPFQFIPDEFRRLGGQTGAGGLQRLMLQFDVSTVDPNDAVVEISQSSYPTYSNFGPLFAANIEYEMTTVASDGGPVGSVHFEELPDLGFMPKVATTSISASDQLTVKSTIWLYNGATVGGYVIGFEVIPEPQSVLLSLSAMFGMLLVRNSRRERPRR
jgi:hypothetical protein